MVDGFEDGRMRSATGNTQNADLRKELSRQIKDCLHCRGLSEAAAARELGVTRQAMNKYVQGTSAPRIPVLLRAEAAWQIKFKFRGITLFGERAGPQPEARSLIGEQMPLFDQPQLLENQAIRISATKSRRTLDVHLRLKLTG